MNGRLKSITAVSVFVAWMTLPSCTREFNPDISLQREVKELQERTLPPGSRLVNQHPLTLQGLGASASWEIESDYSPDACKRWVTGRLQPDFQVHETANSGLRFNKFAHGDEEALSLETASSSGTPQIAFKLEIYPD